MSMKNITQPCFREPEEEKGHMKRLRGSGWRDRRKTEAREGRVPRMIIWSMLSTTEEKFLEINTKRHPWNLVIPS